MCSAERILLSRGRLAIWVQSGRKTAFALHPLTPIAEVYTASQVRFFDNHATAYRAGFVYGISTESGSVSSCFTEKVFFCIPASLCRHFLESRFHGVEKDSSLTVGKRLYLPLRMNPGVVEDILQNTVTQTGYPLLGGEECLGA